MTMDIVGNITELKTKVKIVHVMLISVPAYSQVSNIRRTLLGSKIVGHSDVVGASPVGAAPTTSSFST